MSTYPIKVHSQTFDHRGGTKSYHLMLIETADGRSVFINRWGKKGQFGELQVKEFDDKIKAWKEYERKERDKTKNGYAPEGPARDADAATSGNLVKAIGLAVFNKMGAKAVRFIDPDFDTTGMREAEPNRLDEDGRLTGDDKPRKADIANQLKADREKEMAEAYANNPLFGAF